MKDLFERSHRLVWQQSLRLNKKARHLSLPAFVHFTASHSGARFLETVGFQISHPEPIQPEEKQIVIPAGLLQGFLHLWPNRAMAFFVFLNPLRLHVQNKTDPLHEIPLAAGRTKVPPTE